MFTSDRPSLRQIQVKGDLIVKPETQNGESCSPLNSSESQPMHVQLSLPVLVLNKVRRVRRIVLILPANVLF